MGRAVEADVSVGRESLSEVSEHDAARLVGPETPEAIAALLSYDEASEEARGPPQSEGSGADVVLMC